MKKGKREKGKQKKIPYAQIHGKDDVPGHKNCKNSSLHLYHNFIMGCNGNDAVR